MVGPPLCVDRCFLFAMAALLTFGVHAVATPTTTFTAISNSTTSIEFTAMWASSYDISNRITVTSFTSYPVKDTTRSTVLFTVTEATPGATSGSGEDTQPVATIEYIITHITPRDLWVKLGISQLWTDADITPSDEQIVYGELEWRLNLDQAGGVVNPRAGRLEVRSGNNSAWGTVCFDNITNAIGLKICQAMFPATTVVYIYYAKGGKGYIAASSVTVAANTGVLTATLSTPAQTNHLYTHKQDLGLYCKETAQQSISTPTTATSFVLPLGYSGNTTTSIASITAFSRGLIPNNVGITSTWVSGTTFKKSISFTQYSSAPNIPERGFIFQYTSEWWLVDVGFMGMTWSVSYLPTNFNTNLTFAPTEPPPTTPPTTTTTTTTVTTTAAPLTTTPVPAGSPAYSVMFVVDVRLSPSGLSATIAAKVGTGYIASSTCSSQTTSVSSVTYRNCFVIFNTQGSATGASLCGQNSSMAFVYGANPPTTATLPPTTSTQSTSLTTAAQTTSTTTATAAPTSVGSTTASAQTSAAVTTAPASASSAHAVTFVVGITLSQAALEADIQALVGNGTIQKTVCGAAITTVTATVSARSCTVFFTTANAAIQGEAAGKNNTWPSVYGAAVATVTDDDSTNDDDTNTIIIAAVASVVGVALIAGAAGFFILKSRAAGGSPKMELESHEMNENSIPLNADDDL